MKGQTQAVTAVMITGIMVGTISAVYVWGTPLLDKRESQAELDQIETDVISLKNEIDSIGDSGSGAGSEINLRLNDGDVYVNEEENYIEITSFAANSMYPEGTWRILEGNNLQGLSFVDSSDYGITGQESSGVVAVRSDGSEGEDRITYRVEFRNLQDDSFDGPIMELLDIQLTGAERSSGETTVSIVNEGTETEENGFELQSGENIDHERTIVEVDLQ